VIYNVTMPGSNTVGSTLSIASGATVELAGTTSATSDGTSRVNITNAGTLSVTGSSQAVGSVDGTGQTNMAPNAVLTADHIRQGALTLSGSTGNDQGTVVIRQSGNNSVGTATGVSRVTTLLIAGDPLVSPPSVPYPSALKTYYATLDLTNNDLIVDNANLSDITDMIRSGMGDTTSLTWAGMGLTSSYAQTGNPLAGTTGLGVIRNVANPGLAFGPAMYANSNGQVLAGNEILVKYTWYGDFDLDGQVTSLDFALLDAGFAGTKQFDNQPGWFFGDANLDGQVNSFDYTLATAGYNGYTSNGNLSLPEPSTVMLMVLGMSGLIATFCRKQTSDAL